MTGLIPLAQRTIAGAYTRTVSARKLHEFLGVGRAFANWIRSRIQQYGFVENQDFILICQNGQIKSKGGDRRSKDYYLTLDMAKELAMVERTERGREARRYFIDCERQLKEKKSQQLNTRQRALVVIEDNKITEFMDATDYSLVHAGGLRVIRRNLLLLADQMRWLEGEASAEILEKQLKKLR
ncbi:MAG: antA/AntB antirepressor family protein [Candidatus Thiodiazotropha sp. (ex Dulcina madagascariensis)]|nr:antA/AntB antirepressor family protein [Candidatus Thiodiazotropha sp. (ex Dulcina madagascariensis)]